MKKILFLLATIITLTACECPYGGWDNYGYRESKTTAKLSYSNDAFCADKLLGTWQMDYGCNVGNIELKQIKFFDGWRCDITMAKSRDTDWYTETWTYTYYGNTIKFSRSGRNNFSFAIKGYIFPELYLWDSFGTYTWRKVRSYGC